MLFLIYGVYVYNPKLATRSLEVWSNLSSALSFSNEAKDLSATSNATTKVAFPSGEGVSGADG